MVKMGCFLWFFAQRQQKNRCLATISFSAWTYCDDFISIPGIVLNLNGVSKSCCPSLVVAVLDNIELCHVPKFTQSYNDGMLRTLQISLNCVQLLSCPTLLTAVLVNMDLQHFLKVCSWILLWLYHHYLST